MNLCDIEVGAKLVYYPTKIDKTDNRHPRCTVVAIKGKRVEIETEAPLTVDGSLRRFVSPRTLAPQSELPV
jgi:hypothetical protein